MKLSHLWRNRRQLLQHAATKYPVYIFHHIPKCGGTSMVYSLRKWFVISPDYVDVKEQKGDERLDLRRFNNGRCLVGHFGHKGYHLETRYPEIFRPPLAKTRHRIFSFLRDPLEMRCSFYRHKKKFEPQTMSSLADSIMEFPNYYSRILRVNEDNYEEKLDRYFYFGIYEELQTSFDVFAAKIDKPRIELPFENTTKKTSADGPAALSKEQIDAFKASSALDYKIYEYAKRRYEEDKSKYLSELSE